MHIFMARSKRVHVICTASELDDNLSLGLTPGQKETSNVAPEMSLKAASLAEATLKVLESPSEPMEGILQSQIEELVASGEQTEEGFWKLVHETHKRKGRGNSTDDDSDSTVKASFGNFSNSIISTGSSMSKKKLKEDDEGEEMGESLM